jgi:hypothetical protein
MCYQENGSSGILENQSQVLLGTKPSVRSNHIHGAIIKLYFGTIKACASLYVLFYFKKKGNISHLLNFIDLLNNMINKLLEKP